MNFQHLKNFPSKKYKNYSQDEAQKRAAIQAFGCYKTTLIHKMTNELIVHQLFVNEITISARENLIKFLNLPELTYLAAKTDDMRWCWWKRRKFSHLLNKMMLNRHISDSNSCFNSNKIKFSDNLKHEKRASTNGMTQKTRHKCHLETPIILISQLVGRKTHGKRIKFLPASNTFVTMTPPHTAAIDSARQQEKASPAIHEASLELYFDTNFIKILTMQIIVFQQITPETTNQRQAANNYRSLTGHKRYRKQQNCLTISATDSIELLRNSTNLCNLKALAEFVDKILTTGIIATTLELLTNEAIAMILEQLWTLSAPLISTYFVLKLKTLMLNKMILFCKNSNCFICHSAILRKFESAAAASTLSIELL
jgi:hypothetical protein